MRRIIIDNKYNDKKYELMFVFLSSFTGLSVDRLEERLKNFVEGRGIFLNDVGVVFSNDPSENIPGVPREFEELENFEGVGIYCDWYEEESPVLLTYQEFFENLLPYVNVIMNDEPQAEKDRINEWMIKNIERYNVLINQ